MAETIQVSIPQETVNDESVRVLVWRFSAGTIVEKDVLICEVETSKATLEIYAPAAGILMYSAAVGDEVPIGATICEIVPDAAPQAVSAAASNGYNGASRAAAAALPDLGPARFTPLALKIAEANGLDRSAFAPGTLVRRDDVLRKLGKLPLVSEPAPARAEAPRRTPAKNAATAGVPVEWRELPRRKVLEGDILAGGQAATVASAVTRLCPAPRLRQRAQKLGLGDVGICALVVFECARLLRKYPMFNAVHDNQRIGRYRQVNIGWALDGGQKLTVPVVPQADEKSLREIAATMQSQLESYVSDALTPSALAGGTFTITDLSGDGISFFHPLISQGQAAILGIGADKQQEGETFFLTLAFDHQLAEGRTAAQFLRELSERLEAHAALENEPLSADEPFCVVCQRGAAALAQLRAVLLRSEVPKGLVCSLCVSGWR